MKVKPIYDRILVKVTDVQEKTKGGIIIPDTAKDSSILEGVVTAVGEGRLTDEGKRLALTVGKGDKVLIGKYAGSEFKLDGSEYRIIREDDVLGILE